VEFYTLRAGVSLISFWRKMLSLVVFFQHLREPDTSEKTARETTMCAALSVTCTERAKPLENQARVPLASFP
jgi:hypothetical protein